MLLPQPPMSSLYFSSDWFIASGTQYCQLTTSPTGESCIHDGVGSYGSNELCMVQAVRGLYATATQYDINTAAYVSVNNIPYAAPSAGPQQVWMPAGGTIQWQTAASTEAREGFMICASHRPSMPPPLPPLPPPSYELPWSADWFITSGLQFCQLTISPAGESCVHDGLGIYGGNEQCVVQAARGLYVTASLYDIHRGAYVSINGVSYTTRHNGPNRVWMTAGQTLQWRSDSTTAREGFVLCASRGPSMPPPLPPLTSPPLPPPLPPLPPHELPWSADWFITSGLQFCQLTISPAGESCVHDGLGIYGGNEQCVVQAARGLYVTASLYDIHRGAYVSINGVSYTTRHNGPNRVWMTAGQTLQWRSDSTTAREGFVLCASRGPSMPPPLPPQPLPLHERWTPVDHPWSSDWFISSGINYCQIITSPTGESCIHDGLGSYGGDEQCVVQAVHGLYATAITYDIETGHDYVSINGTRYPTRYTGPRDVWMNTGETLQWHSDRTSTREGFVVCASMHAHAPPPSSQFVAPPAQLRSPPLPLQTASFPAPSPGQSPGLGSPHVPPHPHPPGVSASPAAPPDQSVPSLAQNDGADLGSDGVDGPPLGLMAILGLAAGVLLTLAVVAALICSCLICHTKGQLRFTRRSRREQAVVRVHETSMSWQQMDQMMGPAHTSKPSSSTRVRVQPSGVTFHRGEDTSHPNQVRIEALEVEVAEALENDLLI